MEYISVLGPRGTFSDVACQMYLEKAKLKKEIKYYPTIVKTGYSVNETKLAILPFENSLDGYVIETLDLLHHENLNIITDLYVDISFSFVSKASDINKIKKVFVQFKAKGQCLEFITKNDFEIIITQSNIESLESLLENGESYGAIVPTHAVNNLSFNTFIPNVCDKENNQTRFLVVDLNESTDYFYVDLKCLMDISPIEDRPGILIEILQEFNNQFVNLSSIMSRPTKEEMGKYHFYLEFNFKKKDINSINELIKKLKTKYAIKVFGIYSTII